VLPTLWFRNTWSWGREGESYGEKPTLRRIGPNTVRAEHDALPPMVWRVDPRAAEIVFTENETNTPRPYGVPSPSPHGTDAFHDYVIRGARDAVSPDGMGTKAAALYRFEVPARGELVLRMRLTAEGDLVGTDLDSEFDRTFARRIEEADAFFAERTPK